jgi:hypothetical protein
MAKDTKPKAAKASPKKAPAAKKEKKGALSSLARTSLIAALCRAPP